MWIIDRFELKISQLLKDRYSKYTSSITHKSYKLFYFSQFVVSLYYPGFYYDLLFMNYICTNF